MTIELIPPMLRANKSNFFFTATITFGSTSIYSSSSTTAGAVGSSPSSTAFLNMSACK